MHEAKIFRYQIDQDSQILSLFIYSEGGFVEVTHSQGYDLENKKYYYERRAFRPESPIFNTDNQLVSGNLLIKLNDQSPAPKIINLTYANITPSDSIKAGFAISFSSSENDKFDDRKQEFEVGYQGTISVQLILLSS